MRSSRSHVKEKPDWTLLLETERTVQEKVSLLRSVIQASVFIAAWIDLLISRLFLRLTRINPGYRRQWLLDEGIYMRFAGNDNVENTRTVAVYHILSKKYVYDTLIAALKLAWNKTLKIR